MKKGPNITIHREGKVVLTVITVILLILNFCCYHLLGGAWFWCLLVVSLFVMALFLNFFRVSRWQPLPDRPNDIVAPADGTVVAIEPCFEGEVLKENYLQISVFMTMFDAHTIWTPIAGHVQHVSHRNGRFWSAYLPKSSQENEHSNVVILTEFSSKPMMTRMIAGAVARRICNYARPGDRLQRNDQLGFIRFGSRTDIFLPVGETEVQVHIGDHVTGGKTVLATFKTASL